MIVRCAECSKVVNKSRNLRRGLCDNCYRDPMIRGSHEPLPRGCNGGVIKGRHWTMFEIGRLFVLFNEGCSDRQIALQLGRTEASVKWKRQSFRRHGRTLKVTPKLRGQHQKANRASESK